MSKGEYCSGVHTLLENFQAKLDLVKDCLLLSNGMQDTHNQEVMQQVKDLLWKLQVTLTLLRGEVDKQKQGLATLKQLELATESDIDRIKHAHANMPQHISKQETCVNHVPETPKPVKCAEKPVPKSQVPDSALKKKKPSAPSVEFLTIDEFNSTPKYMKGRLTYEGINHAIAEFNKAFAYKHSIVSMPRARQNISVKNQIVAFKEQETKASDGYFFIVDRDILANTQMKLDSGGRNCLTIMRHCGRIKEVRGGQLTRYCICQPDY